MLTSHHLVIIIISIIMIIIIIIIIINEIIFDDHGFSDKELAEIPKPLVGDKEVLGRSSTTGRNNKSELVSLQRLPNQGEREERSDASHEIAKGEEEEEGGGGAAGTVCLLQSV